jgi:excisionase family DNA binding protein
VVEYDLVSMLSVAEVSDLLHVHPNTLRRWGELGLIPTFRVGPRGDRRYRRADVEAYLAGARIGEQAHSVTWARPDLKFA